MKLKKLSAIILSLFLAFSLGACSKEKREQRRIDREYKKIEESLEAEAKKAFVDEFKKASEAAESGEDYEFGDFEEDSPSTKNPEDDLFIMENFEGFNYDEVSNYLKREGINHVKVEKSSDNVGAGYIIEQNIPAGIEVNKADTFFNGGELILTVSVGSENVVLPDIIGQNADEAINSLQNDYGLVVMTREQYTIETGKGKIIEMSPSVGSIVKKGSRVNLTISKGKNKGPIPDVVKQRLSDAVNYLNSIGFNTEVHVPSNLRGEESSLYVVDMTPDAGTTNYDGTVTILAGTYEDANPTTTTTMEETTSTEATTTEGPTTTADIDMQ